MLDTPNGALSIILEATCVREAVRVVQEGLHRYNLQHTPDDDY